MEEIKHKPIHKGVQLFDALTKHTLEIVAKTQLPYFHFSEVHQTGDSFGDRFTNSIQEVFSKGYDYVLTIGNDSPQLKTAHILGAVKQLHTRKLVVGPSTDGGFYLMGFHKSQFNASQLSKISWQTSRLAKELYAVAEDQTLEIVQLQSFLDIDTSDDIKAILNFIPSLGEELRRVLLTCFYLPEKKYIVFTSYDQNLSYYTPHNKGSPVYC